MKAFASGVLILVLVAFTSCAAPTARQKQMDQFEQIYQSLKDEKEVGRQMAAKLAGTFGIYENPEVGDYVRLVGLTVASRSSRPEITYRFAVLKSEEVNAFATPGGYIFLTTALLRTVRNESELAGILGHEVAHVTQKHMYQMIAPKHEVTVGETLTRLLSRGATDLGFSIGKIVNAGMDLLLEKGLGPELESDADEVGSTFAMSAGYAPDSLLEYLKFLQVQNSTVQVSKTHPPFPARIARLGNYLQKNGFLGSPSLGPEIRQDRFMRALAVVRGEHPLEGGRSKLNAN